MTSLSHGDMLIMRMSVVTGPYSDRLTAEM